MKRKSERSYTNTIGTVEPPIKDTIEITSNKGQGSIYQINAIVLIIIFLTSDKGQPLNKGQNGQKTMVPKRVRYSEVPLYNINL